MNVLTITAENCRETYCRLEWLANCVEKKLRKGIPVPIDYLANCATMREIVRSAKKMHVECGGEVFWGREYEAEARRELAESVCEMVEYALI